MNFMDEEVLLERLQGLQSQEWGTELSPVQRVKDSHSLKDFWLKRDDMYERAGVRGGKVRSAWFLCTSDEYEGLVTAGAKTSPQINIIAHIAKELGLPMRAHCPSGELGVEVASAQSLGADIIQHKPGYNTVIVARAREDAETLGWKNVPFGMECDEAVLMTALQVGNLPEEVNQIVMPVGSGMSFCGVLWGLEFFGLTDRVKVTGVQVGANPNKRLEKYAPTGWDEYAEIVKSSRGYHEFIDDNYLDVTPESCEGGTDDGKLNLIEIDPIYEAKCKPFLYDVINRNESGTTLFWIVGLR